MLLSLLIALAQAQAAPERMDGLWSVDLSARADQHYLKPMTLSLKPDGQVTGRFYDSDIQAGRWKAQNGRLCVAFRTTDGQGPYHSAACLDGDRIEGQTWAEHRNFVFIWTATRAG